MLCLTVVFSVVIEDIRSFALEPRGSKFGVVTATRPLGSLPPSTATAKNLLVLGQGRSPVQFHNLN